MNKKLLFFALLFALCCFISGIAFSDVISSFKVASVDIPKVISASKDVQNLRENTKIQTTQIADYITKIKEDLQKETDIQKRKNLEDSYNKKLKEKKEKLAQNKIRQITYIDKKIKNTVSKIATKRGFNLVLSKNAVLYGSEDITSEIINK